MPNCPAAPPTDLCGRLRVPGSTRKAPRASPAPAPQRRRLDRRAALRHPVHLRVLLFELRREDLQVGVQLRGRGVWCQARDDAQRPARAAASSRQWRHVERHPRRRCREVRRKEILRQHTDEGVRDAVDCDLAPDGVGGSSHLVLPEAPADDRDVAVAGPPGPPECRLNPQRREVRRGDVGADDGFTRLACVTRAGRPAVMPASMARPRERLPASSMPVGFSEEISNRAGLRGAREWEYCPRPDNAVPGAGRAQRLALLAGARPASAPSAALQRGSARYVLLCRMNSGALERCRG